MSNNTVIELPDRLTIHHIENQFIDLKLAFQSAGDNIAIDASKIDNIDTSGLQSLLALIKDAQQHSKTVTWQNIPDTLKECASQIGLTDSLKLS